MIQIEKTEVVGFEPTIRGMRNPMNSWDKSDSKFIEEVDFDPCDYPDGFMLGKNDHELMRKLAKAGPVHGKYLRMIGVYMDVTAPLYWWKEFDTYKIGTVTNSCSTMHKIHAKEFTLEDFSHEHLIQDWNDDNGEAFVYSDEKVQNLLNYSPLKVLELIIKAVNINREAFLKTNDKKFWWQMIQLLPSSYNQKRTIKLNYQVLSNIYPNRREHKLDEWREFCAWIEQLPYSDLITCTADLVGDDR
jgi:hypothetical protein